MIILVLVLPVLLVELHAYLPGLLDIEVKRLSYGQMITILPLGGRPRPKSFISIQM
jgi:hypothetical protein